MPCGGIGGTMLNYVVRRLLYAVPILFGVLILTFALFRHFQTPEKIAISKLGPKATEIERAAFIKEEGLDQPKLVQLGRYLAKTARFDFGTSWKHDRPVSEIFKSGIGPTLLITIPGYVCGIIAALAIALYQVFV